ncbi:outer dynein arm-docking complex subunit 4 isoform X2 [Pleuronectes platessa]|uniref:outer dynein arm-docking complex subunit 4 isoform X2 n=1 Tax=Pleuronectes platessa TaxID=8262 RepID=UPI00232A217D|nr:outer dynein arm-docking complex subunit 4 isoform X2 [Pleuronectes platessa]
MSETEGDAKAPKSRGVFCDLMDLGNVLCRRGDWEKAAESFTTALTLRPDEKNGLVCRSRCYLHMGQFENALRDSEASLNDDKTFCEGLYQKAEALYHMGELEFALVFYHRGQKLRPQMQEFRLGIQKAQDDIVTCINSNTSVKLKMNEDASFLQKDEEKAQPSTSIQPLTEENKDQSQKTLVSEKVTRQLFGEFYSDKKYLENLLKDDGLVKSKTKGGENLQDVIRTYLKYLDTCTDHFNRKKPGKREKQSKPKCSKQRPGAPREPARFLLKSLDDIDAELTSGNAEGSLKKAKEVMEEVQRWSEKVVPDKKEVLGSLHSCIGNALIELGDMDNALEHHQKDLELAVKCNHQEAMSRALDNIGRIYAQIGDFTKAIEFWEKKIPLLRHGVEKTWLFHEIGRCYLELGLHKEARDYGVRSLAAADEIADDKWHINANVLVAQSEMKLGNIESCVASFERALTHAKLQEDHFLTNAIQKALDEAKTQLSR